MTPAEKIDDLCCPDIAFVDTSLPDALTYLRLEAYRLDEDEPDPARRGVHIGYLLPDAVAADLRVSASFHEANLQTALAEIAHQAGLFIFINTSGVYLWLPDGACAAPGPEPIIPGLPCTPPTVEDRKKAREASVARVLALCPAIDDTRSPEGKEFARLYGQYQASNDALMQSDNAPYFLALATLENLRACRPSRLRSIVLAVKAAWACLRWNLAARVPPKAAQHQDER